MASRTCWSCDRLTHMRPHGQAIFVPINPPGGTPIGWYYGAYLCDNCGTMSIASTVQEYVHMIPQDLNYVLESSGEISWLPVKARGKAFPDVPEQIAAAANEAHQCLDINARRGAVMLARAVIEATAKEKGVSDGTLFKKIESLQAAGHIRPDIKEGAHEVRLLGNDMAHGDFVEDVDAADAELVLTLMDELLAEVFQSPAKVAKARQVREAKKQVAK